MGRRAVTCPTCANSGIFASNSPKALLAAFLRASPPASPPSPRPPILAMPMSFGCERIKRFGFRIESSDVGLGSSDLGLGLFRQSAWPHVLEFACHRGCGIVKEGELHEQQFDTRNSASFVLMQPQSLTITIGCGAWNTPGPSS